MECLEHASQYAAKRSAKARERGVCVRCRKCAARPKKRMCLACAQKNSSYVDRYLSKSRLRPLTFFVSAEIAEAVREAAGARGESVSEWLRTSIRRSLSRMRPLKEADSGG